jgi:hypothetical protein
MTLTHVGTDWSFLAMPLTLFAFLAGMALVIWAQTCAAAAPPSPAQAAAKGGIFWTVYRSAVKDDLPWPLGRRLKSLLDDLFGDRPYHLDHDPALILRKFNKRTGKYTPNANDPDYLIYRARDEHQQKTTGRKPGASRTITTKGSDIGIKTKFARLERKTRKKRTTIHPRGFGPGKRKIPSRPLTRRPR